MKPEWRAPACYLGVALICALYLWTASDFTIADVMAGAGLGAAAMWALNDWETRHPASPDRRDEDEAPRRREPRRQPASARPRTEADDPPRRTRPVRADDERAVRRPRRYEEPAEIPVESVRRRAAERPVTYGEPNQWEDDGDWRDAPAPTPAQPPRETPIEAWRREVLERDLARMEEKLRQLAEPRPEETPFGSPERPTTAKRPAGERMARPARLGGGRAFPRG